MFHESQMYVIFVFHWRTSQHRDQTLTGRWLQERKFGPNSVNDYDDDDDDDNRNTHKKLVVRSNITCTIYSIAATFA